MPSVLTDNVSVFTILLQAVIAIVMALDSFPETMQSGNISVNGYIYSNVRHSPKTVGALLEGHKTCLDEECKVITMHITDHNLHIICSCSLGKGVLGI